MPVSPSRSVVYDSRVSRLLARAAPGLFERSKLRLAGLFLMVTALAGCTPSLYGWTVRTSSTPTFGSFSPWTLEREPVAIFEAHAPGGLRGNEVGLAGYLADILKTIATDMLEVSGDDLDLRDGFAEVRGVPGLRKSFREIAVRSIGMPGFSMPGGMSPGLENTAYFQPDQSTYSNGTHVAEVEVDIETGQVKIVRYTVLHDCGHVINPMVVEGQVVGGVAHGVGNALFEQLAYDRDAQPLSVNFGEYLLPLATDMPPIDIHHSETPSPLNPLGLKGAGEGGTIPAPAAIVSAIEDALAPFGVRFCEAPLTPARIVEALRRAGAYEKLKEQHPK